MLQTKKGSENKMKSIKSLIRDDISLTKFVKDFLMITPQLTKPLSKLNAKQKKILAYELTPLTDEERKDTKKHGVQRKSNLQKMFQMDL